MKVSDLQPKDFLSYMLANKPPEFAAFSSTILVALTKWRQENLSRAFTTAVVDEMVDAVNKEIEQDIDGMIDELVATGYADAVNIDGDDALVYKGALAVAERHKKIEDEEK